MTITKAARAQVNVQFSGDNKSILLPSVFLAPIRLDIVRFVHTNLNKNRRQPVGVHVEAGHQTSAESWGTGRAVARIPRVGGGGTHRSGQGAFGNMCRGGRMFAPTKTFRRWHRKVNVNLKRFATVSAIAASALPSLVLARGHSIEQIPEVPLVIAESKLATITKTKDAVALLKEVGAYADIERVKASRRIRAGRGKSRNRRYVQKLGPLVVYGSNNNFVKAFRNISGVEFQSVNSLNLLRLAPGGHLGRFIIWAESAFEELETIYGSQTVTSQKKKGYKLPYAKMSNPDLAKIFASDNIRAVLRPRIAPVRAQRKTPSVANKTFLLKLNPHAATVVPKVEVPKAEQEERAKILDAYLKNLRATN